jgi:electron transport complex protein RnfD
MERIALNTALGPHIHDGSSVTKVMNGHILALLPAVLFGCMRYGAVGVRTLLLAVGSAIVFEWAARKLMKQEMSLQDSSAMLQGLLLGMILPANCSWWLVIIGTFMCIVITKQFFGGIGSYPLNPVVASYAILLLSWPLRVSSGAALAGCNLSGLPLEPLIALKSYGPSVADVYSLKELFLGNQMGGLGTGSALLLTIGGLFLIMRGFIPWVVSVSYLAGIIITAGLFNLSDSVQYAGPMFHLFSGMTMMGAFFMVTDSTTCPVNNIARIIYGFCGGMLIILIRNIGVYPDGTVYAILIVNLFHPLIDRIHGSVLVSDAN